LNGAESLVHSLLASGVNTCFANPGTSEMHFVAALDRIPGLRCVLGLFEGVVTGAADGYARMADRPAVTLLHCGPGLANGLANLHNARRARSPIVNVVGDQASYHMALDPPLASDTEGWARGVSAWTRTAASPASIGADAAVAVQAARTSPGRIATLIAPADACWGEGGIASPALSVPEPPKVPAHVVSEVAAVLRRGEPALILLGGKSLRAGPLADAHRIAGATGARVMAQGFNARVERGRGRLAITRLPYAIDQALSALAGVRHLILVGAAAPVAPFAYPNKPNRLTPPDADIHVLARPEHDLPDVLARLAEEVGAPHVPIPESQAPESLPRGAVSSEAVAGTLAAVLPEGAVVVDESVSFGRSFFGGLAAAPPHDWLQITGAAIGSGLPMATGAAIAASGRRVLNLQADGSAMYTVQALWTQARERLPVTTVILSNRKYAILLGELAHVGANPGRTALDMMDLGNPDLDWCRIAEGLGVEAAATGTLEGLADLLRSSFGKPHPFLIELAI
jgi:acetolactate synthase I/II/III large subunit